MLRHILIVSALAVPAAALAQSTSGVGTASESSSSDGSSATVGSGGSAAAGGTSATSLGTAGASQTDDASGQSMAVGGSAAGGKTQSQAKVNPNATSGHSRATSNAGGGTWSKSMTHTREKNGDLSSRTRSMAHEPGGPPVKSTVESESALPE